MLIRLTSIPGLPALQCMQLRAAGTWLRLKPDTPAHPSIIAVTARRSHKQPGMWRIPHFGPYIDRPGAELGKQQLRAARPPMPPSKHHNRNFWLRCTARRSGITRCCYWHRC